MYVVRYLPTPLHLYHLPTYSYHCGVYLLDDDDDDDDDDDNNGNIINATDRLLPHRSHNNKRVSRRYLFFYLFLFYLNIFNLITIKKKKISNKDNNIEDVKTRITCRRGDRSLSEPQIILISLPPYFRRSLDQFLFNNRR